MTHPTARTNSSISADQVVTSFRIFSPAKINLFLTVLSKRGDGYHNIETVFLPLSWGDDLVISVKQAPRTRILCRSSGPINLSGKKNLAYRAAELWLQASGLQARVKIEIDKKIWVSGGLGGGSSNAGGVLRSLVKYAFMDRAKITCDLPKDISRRAVKIARVLGADVPFFLDPRPSFASGVGTTLKPLDAVFPSDLRIVLVNPNRFLSTRDVYSRFSANASPRWPRDIGQMRFDTVDALANMIQNDLEPAAAQMVPEIALIRSLLIDLGAASSGLSGSGPTVFGLFDDAVPARAAAISISKEYGYSTICTTLWHP